MKNLIVILAVLITTQAQAGSLTLFAYPPKKELNWKSPKTAIWNFLGIEVIKTLFPGEEIVSHDPEGSETVINQYYKSTMGHTIAHIQCETSRNEKFETWTSFSGQNFIEVDKKNILKDKLEIGVLFYDYIDGHIIRGEENIKRLVYYTADKRDGKKTEPRYLKVAIGNAQCDELKNMVTFFESFNYSSEATFVDLKNKSKEDLLYFTTNLDPYDSYKARQKNSKALVGGGCAPYGVAMLKIIGEYDSSLEDEFLLRLKISNDQLGSSENPVSIQSLLFGERGNHWMYRDSDYREMNQYDPAHIWKFLGKLQICLEGAECSINDNTWVQKNRERLVKGPVIKLQDTRITKKLVSNGDGKLEEVSEEVTTQVKIEGIILN